MPTVVLRPTPEYPAKRAISAAARVDRTDQELYVGFQCQ